MSGVERTKHAVWRKRYEQFANCRLTVSQFCRQEGVSVSSFYKWRQPADKPLPRRRRAGRVAAFQRVTVAPQALGVSNVLANGMRIEMGAENTEALRAVVCALAGLAGPVPAGAESC